MDLTIVFYKQFFLLLSYNLVKTHSWKIHDHIHKLFLYTFPVNVLYSLVKGYK